GGMCDTSGMCGLDESGFFLRAKVFCSAPLPKQGKPCMADADCDTMAGNGVCVPWKTRSRNDSLRPRLHASAVANLAPPDGIRQQDIQAALTKNPYDMSIAPTGWIHP